MSAAAYMYRHRRIVADDEHTSFTVPGIRGTFPSIEAARAAIDAACCDQFKEQVRAGKGYVRQRVRVGRWGTT